MKKFLLIFLCVGVLVSCRDTALDGKVTKVTNETVNGSPYNIYEVEGCEYIGMYVGTTHGILTHKGNCKYCKIK